MKTLHTIGHYLSKYDLEVTLNTILKIRSTAKNREFDNTYDEFTTDYNRICRLSLLPDETYREEDYNNSVNRIWDLLNRVYSRYDIIDQVREQKDEMGKISLYICVVTKKADEYYQKRLQQLSSNNGRGFWKTPELSTS